MNKILITLGLTLAATTGAFAQSSALDVYQAPAGHGSAKFAVGVSNDLVSYDRAGNDGSPSYAAPQGGVDYTATGSIGGVSMIRSPMTVPAMTARRFSLARTPSVAGPAVLPAGPAQLPPAHLPNLPRPTSIRLRPATTSPLTSLVSAMTWSAMTAPEMTVHRAWQHRRPALTTSRFDQLLDGY